LLDIGTPAYYLSMIFLVHLGYCSYLSMIFIYDISCSSRFTFRTVHTLLINGSNLRQALMDYTKVDRVDDPLEEVG